MPDELRTREQRALDDSELPEEDYETLLAALLQDFDDPDFVEDLLYPYS